MLLATIKLCLPENHTTAQLPMMNGGIDDHFSGETGIGTVIPVADVMKRL